MNVLYITNNYPTFKHPIFGIFVKEQILSLTKIGVNSEVFFINGKEKGLKEYLKAIIKLKKFVKGKNYDLVHCHHSFSAIVLILSRLKFKKKVLSYQSDPLNEGGHFLFLLNYYFFDRIILKNNSFFLKYPNVIQIQNGVNLNFFIPIEKNYAKSFIGLSLTENYILFMSSNNIRNEKRLDRFNEIINLLNKEYSHLRIKPLILTNTERNLIPYYISASSLHLLTSDFEGSPNSVKECMACNIPVVSTPVGNVKDLFINCNSCFVSDTFDVKEITQLVLQALTINYINSRSNIIDLKLDIDNVALNIYELYKTIKI
jgi:glycosyltransferase involved in cell wall biosynthesis